VELLSIFHLLDFLGSCILIKFKMNDLFVLAHMDGCEITKSTNHVSAFMGKDVADTFFCKNTTLEDYNVTAIDPRIIPLHVVALYGNHFSARTEVTFSGTWDAPFTLVVASVFPVTWRLVGNQDHVTGVIVVSDDDIMVYLLAGFVAILTRLILSLRACQLL